MDALPASLTVEEFSAHFVAIRPRLARFTLRFVDSLDDAEDIVSEVWRSAIDRLAAFEGMTADRLFLSLLQSCRFGAGHWRAKRRRETELVDQAAIDRHSIEFSISSLLSELHPVQRPLARGLGCGLSYREIAEKVGEPVGAVKVRIHRMRQQLRAEGLDARPVWWISLYKKPRGMHDLWRAQHPGCTPQTTVRVSTEVYRDEQ